MTEGSVAFVATFAVLSTSCNDDDGFSAFHGTASRNDDSASSLPNKKNIQP